MAGVGMRGKAAQAAPGDPMILGALNDAGDQQTVLLADPGSPPQRKFGLAVVSSGSGGVVGLSVSRPGEDPPAGPGPGLVGRSGSSPAVVGTSLNQHGVQGVTNAGGGLAVGVVGFSLKPGVDPAEPGSYVPANFGSQPGVAALSGSGAGLVGQSASGPGAAATSGSGPGIFGSSASQVGVHGVTNGEAAGLNAGVNGVSLKPGVDPTLPESYVPENFGSRPGVRGVSGSGPGVQALSLFGPALDVLGAAPFATAGAGVIAAHQKEAAVANPAVTAQSHVTVTLTDDPGGGAVEWVERQAGVGFVVHLTRKVKGETGFTYLVVEPGA